MFQKGDCFLIETNKDNNGFIQSHFFITILEITEKEIVIVNIDKVRGKSVYDKTVILNAEEGHEFVTETSFVNYYKSEITTIECLQEKINKNVAKYYGKMKDDTVEKIKGGVLNSKKTPFAVRYVFENYFFSQI